MSSNLFILYLAVLCASLSFAIHLPHDRNRCKSCAASGGCLRTGTLTKLRDKSQNADGESIRPLLLELSNLEKENLGTHQKWPGRQSSFFSRNSVIKKVRAKFLMLIKSKSQGYGITAFFHAVTAPSTSLAALQEEWTLCHTRVRFLWFPCLMGTFENRQKLGHNQIGIYYSSVCAPSLEDLSGLFTRLSTSSFSCQSCVSLQVIKRCSDLGLDDICVLISCWIKMQL